MNLLKKSTIVFFASLFVISHSEGMQLGEDQNEKKRPASPRKKIEQKIKKLKSMLSETEISLDDSLEEISIEPIFTLKDPYQPISIKTIAEYFILKEAERLQSKREGEKIDYLKLQRMLHYAQGYFYALYGKPLFKEKMVVSSEGCYNESLKEWEVCSKYRSNPMAPLVQGNDVNNYTQTFSEKKINLAPNPSQLLSLIFDYFLRYSGTTLSNKNCNEPIYLELWKNGEGKGKEIPLESLVYYRQTKELADLQKIWILHSFKNNDEDTMKKNIHWILANSTLEENFLHLKNIQESIEQLEEKPKIYLQEWPGQSYSETVLSTLLFPSALRESDELLIPLLLRENTPAILTFLAQKKNPEAKYYLAKFLNLFYPDHPEEENFIEKHQSFYDLKNKLIEKASEGFKKTVEETKIPFLKGLSFFYLNNKAEALQVFQDGCELNTAKTPDLFCFYNAALLKDNINDKKILWERSESLLEKDKNFFTLQEIQYLYRIFLDKGRFAEPLEEGLKAYVQTCALDLPAGYLSIGKILGEESGKDLKELPAFKSFQEKNTTLTSAENFFEEAGNKGLLTGYELAASEALKNNNIKKAQELYLLQGDKGDPFGYLNLAQLYEKQEQYDEAINYYIKAGFLVGGIEQATRILEIQYDEELKAKEFQSFSDKEKKKFFEVLKVFIGKFEEE